MTAFDELSLRIMAAINAESLAELVASDLLESQYDFNIERFRGMI